MSTLLTTQALLLDELSDDEDERPPKRPRTENRGKNNKNRNRRRKFDHDGALLSNINRGYLGPDPLFGSEFAAQFRMSRPWFCRLMEDVMASKNPFFTKTESIVGHSVSSIAAKLLLPLKT
jgi:hypothetical protein